VAATTPGREETLTIDHLRRIVAPPLPVDDMPADLRVLPIDHDGQTRGVMLVWDALPPRAGRAKTRPLSAAVLDLARTALSRALIHREAEQRIAELDAISRLSQFAAHAKTRADEFCRVGAEIALDLAHAESVIAAIGVEPKTRAVVQVGAASALDRAWIESHWDTAQISRTPFEFDLPAERDSRSTHFVLPIVADAELLGVMILAKSAGSFTPHDRAAATRIAGQVAVGLQRITTLELAIEQRSRADRQSATLGRVLEATALFVSVHDRDELLRVAILSAAELLDCARISLYWRDADGETSETHHRRWPGGELPDPTWERWFIEDAMLTSTARRHSDLGSDPRLQGSTTGAGLASGAGIHLLVTPIGGDSAGMGAIAYTRIGGEPFDDDEFAELRIYAAQLTAALASVRLIGRNRELLVSGIRALVSAVDAKDPYTRGHSERVSMLARMIATQMELPPDEIDTIELAGLLHDFGKIGVPDAILHKPGRLTPAERVIMMRHAGLGADMLAGAESEAMAPIVPLVRHHHEWVNGGGYPDGLIGDQIPLGSAIISVADAYDTMTTDRPYRNRISHRQAMAELNRSMGRQFNASVVEALETLAGTGALPRLHGPELEAPGAPARLPLAAEHQPTPIEDARALKLLLDMIPITHLIADSALFYQQVTDLVRRSLDLPHVALFLTDDADGRLTRIACSGESCRPEPFQQPLAAGIRGAALRSRRFRAVSNVRLDPAYDPAYDPESGSMFLTPLIVDDTVIGLLAAEATDAETLEPTNQPVLQAVADQVGSAVRLAQLHAEARTAALTDPLTGLGNHRAFWTELDDAVAAGSPFAVVMMDVEGLKRINDSLGHLAGDALLLRVAEQIRAVRKPGDLAARLGGDEFALLLRDRSPEAAVALADEIRGVLLRENAGHRAPATIRYGVAGYPIDGERSRDLVASADGRLYAMQQRVERI
jgi:diguanylate cyclase (GGDEF)-like protein